MEGSGSSQPQTQERRGSGEAVGRRRAERAGSGGSSGEDSDGMDSQSDEVDDDSESEDDFEDEDGDDGCGGAGGATGVVVWGTCSGSGGRRTKCGFGAEWWGWDEEGA